MYRFFVIQNINKVKFESGIQKYKEHKNVFWDSAGDYYLF